MKRLLLSAVPKNLKITQALGALIRENMESESFPKKPKTLRKRVTST